MTLSHRLRILRHALLQISSEQQLRSQHGVTDKSSASGALASLAARHRQLVPRHLPFQKVKIDHRQSNQFLTQVKQVKLRLEMEVSTWKALLELSSGVKQQAT